MCNLRRLEMKRRIIQGIKSRTRSSLKTPYREDNDFVEADEVTDLQWKDVSGQSGMEISKSAKN